MKNSSPRRDATVIVFTVLLALVPLALAGAYLYTKHQWSTAKIAEVTPRYARLTGLLSSKENLQQATEQAKTQVAAYVFPSDQDAVQLGNDVQQKVRGLLGSAGLSIVSSQVMPAKEDKEFERIPLAVRAEGELLAVYLAIAGLSEQKPAILLDGFNLQISGPPVKGIQRMAVQLNLSVLRAKK